MLLLHESQCAFDELYVLVILFCLRLSVKNVLFDFLKQVLFGRPRIAFRYIDCFSLLWYEEDSFACLLHEFHRADRRAQAWHEVTGLAHS